MSRPGTFDKKVGNISLEIIALSIPLAGGSGKSERIGWRQIGRNDLR